MRVPGIPYVQGRNSYSDVDGTKYGIAIHNTSNDATAEQEAAYATGRTDGISAHFYVDSNSIVQSLDTDARAGHAGSSEGNQNAVAVEITGVNAWTRQQWLDRVAWDKLGAVLAVVCKRYGIAVRRASVAEMRDNPKVRAFYGHDDMRLAWGGTTHTDPGPNFPWDRLIAAVSAALTGESEDDMDATQAKQLQDIHWSVGRGVPSLVDGKMIAVTWWAGQVVGLLREIGARVDLSPEEIAAVAAAVPDVDEQAIADGVLAGFGAKPLEDVAAALRSALGSDRATELGGLLITAPPQG